MRDGEGVNSELMEGRQFRAGKVCEEKRRQMVSACKRDQGRYRQGKGTGSLMECTTIKAWLHSCAYKATFRPVCGRLVGKGVDWSLLDVRVNRADVGGVRRREKERERERERERGRE